MSNQKKPKGSDFISSIIPILSELMPMFIEKWADVNNRSNVRELKKDQLKSFKKIGRINRQLKWLYFLLVILFMWNTAVTVGLLFLSR